MTIGRCSAVLRVTDEQLRHIEPEPISCVLPAGHDSGHSTGPVVMPSHLRPIAIEWAAGLSIELIPKPAFVAPSSRPAWEREAYLRGRLAERERAEAFERAREREQANAARWAVAAVCWCIALDAIGRRVRRRR